MFTNVKEVKKKKKNFGLSFIAICLLFITVIIPRSNVYAEDKSVLLNKSETLSYYDKSYVISLKHKSDIKIEITVNNDDIFTDRELGVSLFKNTEKHNSNNFDFFYDEDYADYNWICNLNEDSSMGILEKNITLEAGTHAIYLWAPYYTMDYTIKISDSTKYMTDMTIPLTHKMVVGDTNYLAISNKKPINGFEDISWSSSNTNIAEVHKTTGAIKAKKKGKAIVTAVLRNGKKYKCDVDVIDNLMKKTSVTLLKGKSTTLSLKAKKPNVKWSSSNNKVVKVTSSGKVSAIASGKAVITAKVDGISYSCNVTVEDPKLNKTKISIYTIDTLKLTLNNASGKVTWSSSKKSVATVDDTGKVSAKSSGTAIITAIYAGSKFTCKVTVVKTPPIIIEEVGWDINFLGGVEPYIYLTNTTNKDIKYIDIYTEYYNSVGDPAICEIQDTNKITLNITGPIKKKTKNYEAYWDAVIYNDNMAAMKITKMKITYMDKSTQNITINKLWSDENYYYH